MVRDSRTFGAIALAVGLALAFAGCGGGGAPDGTGTVGAAGITGTVYAPAEAGVAAIEPAAAGDPGEPAPECPVEVRTEPGGQRLASGLTDGAGQFRFAGLPAGATVIVEARVAGCEPLLARARLRVGSSRADVTAQTTLAAICARLALGEGEGAGPGDQEFAGEVAEACLQYQARNGYQFRQGGPPDFGDAGEIEQAASDLLSATTADALERARETRSEQDCERAVRMMMAHLCERGETELRWTEQVVAQLAWALREGAVNEGEVGQVMSRIMNREITAEQVREALRALWQRLGMEEPGRAPEVLEVVAALTGACGDQEMLRLRTRAQVQALVDGLRGAAGPS